MNKNQLNTLGFVLMLIGSWFIVLDTATWSDIDITPGKLTEYDVYNIVNGEIHDPFIWTFFLLGFTCFMLALLEKGTL